RGDSMSSVGYRSGDILAVKRTPDPAQGDIVVARIGTDITLKCLHRPSEDRVELRPCSENPEHCAIVIDGQTDDWEIVGVVVGAMIGRAR
ncbi:MAG: S24 family peptidase, partial [Rhodococcus sp.]|nr:S24 family peptidase [Rhodococcus sp. (in: high G+C Gram-positive bacteria)]